MNAPLTASTGPLSTSGCAVLREPAPGAVPPEPAEVAERAQDRRKRAARRVVEAPVGPLEPAARDTDLGVLVHESKSASSVPARISASGLSASTYGAVP